MQKILMPAFRLAAQPGREGEHSFAGPTAAAGRQLQHPATSCAPAPVCSADGPHACPGWPILGLFWLWALYHSPELHIAPHLSLSAGSEERASVRRPVQGQREWRSQVALRASHMAHNRRSVRPAATSSLAPRSVFKCHNPIMSCKCSSVAEASLSTYMECTGSPGPSTCPMHRVWAIPTQTPQGSTRLPA